MATSNKDDESNSPNDLNKTKEHTSPVLQLVKQKMKPIQNLSASVKKLFKDKKDMTNFGFISQQPLSETQQEELEQQCDAAKRAHVCELRIKLKDNLDNHSLVIYHQERKLNWRNITDKLEDLSGLVELTASEEALASYVLENTWLLRHKQVLELGGGFSCLAGLMAAKYADASHVHVTDGNQSCIEEVRQTMALNSWSCDLSAAVLRWQDEQHYVQQQKDSFDIILVADCLFFKNFHTHLLKVIKYYLKPMGEALVISPPHGQILAEFTQAAKDMGFSTRECYYYSSTVSKAHYELGKSDDDYPRLLQLGKKA